MRTGNEPMTARSPLRLRCGLAAWGALVTAAGTAAFALAGRPGWAVACGVLMLVTLVDLTMIIRHIRQGPHYQPGRDVPPYEPVDERPVDLENVKDLKDPRPGE
ncbi:MULTISPECIES: DUF6343 family protein [Streptomyces]|uniref:Uncharacterized protein n=1 Tax=Streptomyces morookaense TaxID=1970 RepID=A0A7Y7B3A2_STRMO|nr:MULTISPECIES: DUF6343 family protein [Streptomyces]MCC2279260.1 DUF6343 family protein [Streptomyces sp. ET3-23]NVK78245.1 hypothetical protein [Streptomyces morookaense]